MNVLLPSRQKAPIDVCAGFPRYLLLREAVAVWRSPQNSCSSCTYALCAELQASLQLRSHYS